jgi:phage terminase large subunit GpA-like protein
MMVFYNTRRGRAWKVSAASTSAKTLLARAIEEALAPQLVPAAALYVTAAVDVQGDRLEYKAMAWGEGMEHWIIDKRVLIGHPEESKVWEELDELHRTVRYERADGHEAMPIARMNIDAGNWTQDVYNFTRHRAHRGIYSIKGSSHAGRAIIPRSPSKVDFNWRGKQERHGVELWYIGTDTAKEWIFARLEKKSGGGASHFHREMTEDDFDQITAEYRVSRYRRGHKIVEFHKKKNQRNEGLDLYVYNVAAAHMLGLHKMSASEWAKRRAKVCPKQVGLFSETGEPAALPAPVDAPQSPAAQATARAIARPARSRGRSNFVTSY